MEKNNSLIFHSGSVNKSQPMALLLTQIKPWLTVTAPINATSQQNARACNKSSLFERPQKTSLLITMTYLHRVGRYF